MQKPELALPVLLLLSALQLAAAQCPSGSGDWLLFGDSCYKFFNRSEFWYSAETECKDTKGHLVSIGSDQENRLVGKLSLCRDVWIGRYASDLGKLNSPSGYVWTDKSSPSGYSRHNFTEEEETHKPLIRARGFSWYNSLYHEQHPFLCEVPSTGDHKASCPGTMKFYQGNCYLQSSFEATFIEANFFCQNRSTQLASVLSEAELRFLNSMDLEADACRLQPMWLGLVKLNPCYPDRGGRETCYQWTDFSGKHLDFPKWAEGQPTQMGREEQTGTESDPNCVVISGDELLSARCSEHRRFVCKIPAASITIGSPAWEALEKPSKSISEEAAGKVFGSSFLETISKSNISSEIIHSEATTTALPEATTTALPETTTTALPEATTTALPETTTTTELPETTTTTELPETTTTMELPETTTTMELPETTTTELPETTTTKFPILMTTTAGPEASEVAEPSATQQPASAAAVPAPSVADQYEDMMAKQRRRDLQDFEERFPHARTGFW